MYLSTRPNCAKYDTKQTLQLPTFHCREYSPWKPRPRRRKERERERERYQINLNSVTSLQPFEPNNLLLQERKLTNKRQFLTTFNHQLQIFNKHD
jgi:hypothetical protein